MFRIRKIFDESSSSNQDAIQQVQAILREQFPLARKDDWEKIPKQLKDPLKYNYKSILYVMENQHHVIKGFAVVLHLADLNIAYLELLSAAPGKTGGGIGGVLYDHIREDIKALGVSGLYFECSIDDPEAITNKAVLKQNQQRLAFYEKYDTYPIVNNVYASPAKEGDEDLYYLMCDFLGKKRVLARSHVRKAVKAILNRKYGHLLDQKQINEVANSFKDDPIQFRDSRYSKGTALAKKISQKTPKSQSSPIALIVNEGHNIHHVHDRGYVEAPVRIQVILDELNKTNLFQAMPPIKTPESEIKKIHDKAYVDYLRKACETLPPGKSIYPIIFPIRNNMRPPKDIELQVGYYCIDTFTPFNRNAYLAACGAVDCAVTGAQAVLGKYHFAYALVRPPGHHAERRALGGFCYFNSAAIAAQRLLKKGRVAILDIDFHHGNGTQDIFYRRNDVLTISIHGDPSFAYPHFAGFADEKGEGEGLGYNINYPLPEHTDIEKYQATLKKALANIRKFDPTYLVIGLGLDTAKSDPTGTWQLKADDFRENGRMIGALGLKTLIVQEGGYRTRTLGVNAKNFFQGLWAGYQSK